MPESKHTEGRAERSVRFTPGPWTVRATDTTYEVESHDGIRVVRTSWHQRLRKPYPLKPEARANARLIAAAPELYEELRVARDYVEDARNARLCELESVAAYPGLAKRERARLAAIEDDLARIDSALSKASSLSEEEGA